MPKIQPAEKTQWCSFSLFFANNNQLKDYILKQEGGRGGKLEENYSFCPYW